MVSVPQIQTLQGHHRLVQFVVPRKQRPIQRIASLFKIEMVEIESLRFEIKRKTRLTRDALEFTLAKENTAD